MSATHFDEQPDGDPHGECAAEIHRLQDLNAQMLELLERYTAVDIMADMHFGGSVRKESALHRTTVALIAKVKGGAS